MNKFNGLMLFSYLAFLSGCATFKVPTSPIKAPYSNINVGILVDVSDAPKHSHVGTTIFNNFNKEFAFKWTIKEEIFTIFKQQIESQTDLNVIDLDFIKDEITPENSNFVIVENDVWLLNQNTQELRNKLLSKDINVVIIIREGRTLASLECSNYGCNERYSEGHGVFSRSFLGYKTYFASASYFISVESLNPVVDISLLPKLREALFYNEKNKVIKGFKPNKLKDLTESDVNFVKGHILQYLKKVAELTTNYLNGYRDPTSG